MQIMTIRAWRLKTHKPQSLDWGSWLVNGIVFKIINQAKKGISDSQNIVKEKFTDVYFVLDEAVLEYLKSY